MNTGGDMLPYVSIREAVRITGLSERFIRDGVRAGRIPYIPAGKKAMIAIRPFLEQLDAEARTNGSREE